MKRIDQKGLTLVELLLATAILGIIAAAATPLVSICFESHKNGSARFELYHEGLIAMERMTAGVRKTTVVVVPNSQKPSRDILAFSRLVNSDNDFYFGDPLFPRIDEDVHDSFSSGGYGIKGVDEDGDGMFDEGDIKDDDEDGFVEEDWLDGLDNDGDGNIDEEMIKDMNLDGESGILGMDDDGDGQVDEGTGEAHADDDEDGLKDEEGVLFAVYVYNASTKTLSEIHSDPNTGILDPAPKVVLSDHVTSFQVNYEAPEKILISLTLTGDDGESITFTEYVCPRNTFQRTGKRVK